VLHPGGVTRTSEVAALALRRDRLRVYAERSTLVSTLDQTWVLQERSVLLRNESDVATERGISSA
jgi:hypothetical protein